MNIYFDENLPPNFAQGLELLSKSRFENINILSVISEFGRGAKDEDWILEIGKKEACIITQDFNIHRKRAQNELYQSFKIGLFIISPPKKKGYLYWDLVQIITSNWPDIVHKSLNTAKPFAFVHKHSSKNKFEELA